MSTAAERWQRQLARDQAAAAKAQKAIADLTRKISRAAPRHR